MRLFIAIPIPEDVKEKVVSIQEDFRELSSLRFVKKEHMHITMDFLGEIPENRLDAIIRKLDAIKFERFSLTLKGLGSFPSEERIRVIWIGIEDDPAFMALQKDIRSAMGHKEKLMPHLTLARSNTIMKDESLSEKISLMRLDPISFDVDRFILFQSEFRKEGVVHSEIKRFM